MRLTLLSRTSDLAVLQTGLVADALRARWPGIEIVRTTRSSAGDRDDTTPLWKADDKGLFTADLSDDLLKGRADLVVHSWKDLPIEGRPGTRIAATLERADPRDVLLVRREAADARPERLTVLSSSPRRAWQIESTLAPLLPWRISSITTVPVRGNIPTRLAKLVRGDGDALIVAKAALDRLLSDEAPAAARQAVRDALARARWMVLPLREHPTAPAQGALAIEIPANRDDVASTVGAISHQPTWTAVEREREVLASFGGGCHAAVGATMLVRDYGRVLSVRANVNASPQVTWSLETDTPPPPPSAASAIWPRPEERDEASRKRLVVDQPAGNEGFWVARADALPENWTIATERLIWAAGTRTWTRLAARGIWVHGCADGLGDTEPTDIDRLAGRDVAWRRLTHAGTDDPAALATYVVDRPLPGDLDRRTHFFWTSGRLFRDAMAAHPALAGAWHASGPGRTARAIRDNLDSSARVSVWLDYDQWHQTVTR